MRALHNVLWPVPSGFRPAPGHVVAGLVRCLPTIAIPRGTACFRGAGHALRPFGHPVVDRPDAGAASPPYRRAPDASR